jgi:2-polyprenyl-3-methyl-5-hydroxy-6-metoxy-1,4-benzoquinol methylase
MKTKDPVNQPLLDLEKENGIARFGLMTNAVWHEDPKRLLFTLARYKFVAKMLSGTNSVLEIGCGDGFCSRVVKQEVKALTVSDYDPLFISRFSDHASPNWPITAMVHDILSGPTRQQFDAVYSLDVMEHIESEKEHIYLANIGQSIRQDGVAIIGMPSIESQKFASPGSKAGHVNCLSGNQLKESLSRHFSNVFLFSMNDEMVHTGFAQMAHYLIGLCVGVKP